LKPTGAFRIGLMANSRLLWLCAAKLIGAMISHLYFILSVLSMNLRLS
jgi:hypothetical protein